MSKRKVDQITIKESDQSCSGSLTSLNNDNVKTLKKTDSPVECGNSHQLTIENVETLKKTDSPVKCENSHQSKVDNVETLKKIDSPVKRGNSHQSKVDNVSSMESFFKITSLPKKASLPIKASFPDVGIIDEWKEKLMTEKSTSYLVKYLEFVEREEKSGKIVYPPKNLRFEALNLCPPDKVKVVILGQDPYHGVGQAHGLSFSVLPGVPQPPSLKNIISEAVSCVGIKPTKLGCLRSWAKQGVLLLNTVLTVEKGLAGSHHKKGCENFTDEIVRILNSNRMDRSIIFLLWGKASQEKCAHIDTKKHKIIATSHPSPLGASKTSAPFRGSGCFKKANDMLLEMGEEPIDWNL